MTTKPTIGPALARLAAAAMLPIAKREPVPLSYDEAIAIAESHAELVAALSNLVSVFSCNSSETERQTELTRSRSALSRAKGGTP